MYTKKLNFVYIEYSTISFRGVSISMFYEEIWACSYIGETEEPKNAHNTHTGMLESDT